MTKIAYISLGGTIGMMGEDGKNVKPCLGARELLEALNLDNERFSVESHDLMNVASAHLGFADLLRVTELLHRLRAGGVRAAVISQGSDSLEETALFLDLFCPPDMTVVMTCAMLNPALGFSDGPENLRNALRLAHYLKGRDRGCFVVFTDQIFTPLGLRKVAATGLNAFLSTPDPALGRFVEGRIHYRPASRRPAPLSLPPATAEAPKVGLLRYGLDMDPALLRAMTVTGLHGLVVEGMGGGHVAPAMADVLEETVRTMPVVLASRTCFGPALRQTYGYAGGEIDLQNRGLINGGFLDGLKARILLTALLWSRHSPEQIRKYFEKLELA